MTVPTQSLHVRRFSPEVASGPPVLLVHGFASDGQVDWVDSGWPEALNAAGRVALVPDLPGHGQSPAPASAGEASTAVIVEALADILRREQASSADVIAYSLGARLSWELPATSTVPISHLVLGGLSPGEPFAAVDVGALRERIRNGTEPADPMTGMMAGMITGPGKDAEALATCIEGLREEPFSPAVGDITVPTCFVAGSADPMSDGVDGLVELVGGSRLVRVEGDHMTALHGQQFRSAACDFIDARGLGISAVR